MSLRSRKKDATAPLRGTYLGATLRPFFPTQAAVGVEYPGVEVGVPQGRHPSQPPPNRPAVREPTRDDTAAAEDWVRARGLPVPQFLPARGLCAPGVAVGWLVQTDSGFCLLEEFSTNPAASPQDRDAGLEAVIEGLEELAANLGYLAIVVLSNDGSARSRALRHSYRSAGNYELLFKEV